MNIDSLLDLASGLIASGPEGQRVKGRVSEVVDEDIFVFVPEASLDVTIGSIVKITDGLDSVVAKVIEKNDKGLKLCMECYLSPGHERRADVRIYDRVYYSAQLLCHAGEKARALPEALERIHANKLIIDSFLKGRYGYPGSDDAAYQKDTQLNQGLWEINRKLDLLIHMFLAEDFKSLMNTVPRDVNISASGIRFISDQAFDMGDLVEIRLILPMVPLLFVRLVGEVIRQKAVTSTPQTVRFAVAVKFLKVDTETREDIIRYLFRRQREVLRKRQI
ncbi:MAG TPA: PilZ domain-containing protein [Deltaproteobacteria bacterium]|nr:PilZ domain-containing protein [Deltaproteobacteria bacterium]HPR54056.1 PilZ domain-containing protein [Deltaproteobacteria bacterium]HXK46836.1 PilZ domain-containing protein [Deltaproteobacteria bacterium]